MTTGAVAATVLLGASACGQAVEARGDRTPTSSGAIAGVSVEDELPPVQAHDGPCAGTEMKLPATLAELAVKAPLLIPRSAHASIADLESLWACAGGGYSAVFASGVEVAADPGFKVSDPARWWARFVSDNGYGTVDTVRGAPGLIEEPDGDHRGSAEFIIDGWLINVLGNAKLGAKELVSIADTL